MFDDVHYKRPFLDQVICRVDFASEVPSISQRLASPLTQRIRTLFPIAEPRHFVAKQLQVSLAEGGGAVEKSREGTEWVFYGMERHKTLSVTSTNIDIVYKRYESFEALRSEFLGLCQVAAGAYPEIQLRRLGLRYINKIEPGAGNALDWAGLLRPSLFASIQSVSDPEGLSRVMHNLELNRGDIRVRFQFGIANPDYPAPIRQRQFVLDLDAYHHGPVEIAELEGLLDQAHSQIQELFEGGITDELRAVMNG